MSSRIDSDASQLERLRFRVRALGLKNADPVFGRIEEVSFADGFFDLVYSRLVLLHVQNVIEAIRSMYVLVAHGGLCVFEEPVLSATRTYPEFGIWDNEIRVYQEYC